HDTASQRPETGGGHSRGPHAAESHVGPEQTVDLGLVGERPLARLRVAVLDGLIARALTDDPTSPGCSVVLAERHEPAQCEQDRRASDRQRRAPLGRAVVLGVAPAASDAHVARAVAEEAAEARDARAIVARQYGRATHVELVH